MEYKTIARKEIDGVKYHYDIWEKELKRTVFQTIQKVGDVVFINWKGAEELKIDLPIKFHYREVHNETVIIKESQDLPEFIDAEDQLEMIEKTGTRTVIKNFNPEFTVQIKIQPEDWGKLKRLMRRKSRTVDVPKFISEEEWKEILGNNGVWEKLTEEDIMFLTMTNDMEMREWLFETLEKPNRTRWGWRLQALFNLPETETKIEYYYEPVDAYKETGTLKNVDIDVEIIGEDYTHTIHIDKGGIIKNCGGFDRPFNYYGFDIPVLPFICDWFNVPIPKEEKPRMRGIKNVIKNRRRS